MPSALKICQLNRDAYPQSGRRSEKVETYYYDIRKQVFEYDEVMNNQRRAIYAERRRVLEGQDLKEQVISTPKKRWMKS